MKSKCLYIAGLIVLMSCVACGGGHVISDADERAAVERDFKARVESFDSIGVADELFGIFDTQLTVSEREALEFLYAYMPLADIADHDGEYFLKNVRSSFQARREMKWGRKVPEREFRHFVLPIRVNNEDLDESRMVFYEELKNRVGGLSMRDAVLEVNHWCHEKVIYTPSDARTASPLATVRTANGRCGEESTFTVAALRAVGIPARQVYTPRWAHTDDNHAWVEAWVDGQWYFFGACEPEPVLNLAWFNAPASRGMLMHTRVFGAYHGPEDVVRRTARNTEINVTDNYAPTAAVSVLVVDAAGKPVEDATVEFKLYNYAEFYTVATRLTDAEGRSSLRAGKGDLLVWAYKDGRFGYAKASFGTDSEVTVVLEHEAGSFGKAGVAFSEEVDIVPPPESANLPEVTPRQRAGNDRRMAVEDSIRNAYVATFMTDSAAREFAVSHSFFASDPGDDESDESQVDIVAKALVASRGNHDEICRFLESLGPLTMDNAASALLYRNLALQVLNRISTKDLRDVSCEVLRDHVYHTSVLGVLQSRLLRDEEWFDPEWFLKYVLNPRVGNESLTAYKGFFQGVVPEEDQKTFASDPSALVAWVTENIRIDRECNLGACPISPEGVWKARTADTHSRDIFFVALARTFGIPSRIDAVTGKVQILDMQGPIDVDFESTEQTIAPTGRLVARYTPVSYLSDPRYYSHFSISRVNPDGSLRLMTYDEGELDMGGGTSWGKLLKNGSTVEAGDYLLVTGTRLANGSVLSTMTFYTVEPGKTTTIDLVMRESNEEIKVIGSFDSEAKYLSPGEVAQLSGASSESGTGAASA
ncbi:MAG: transglutaminase-like domain-containing protein, partial [Prevotellaceae bacterium]|nr:transglutaminase-like domain-containing protein [Prevotellaceae bacterium]